MSEPVLDPIRDVGLIESALYLAKHLAYAAALAYYEVPSLATAVNLWKAMDQPAKYDWRMYAAAVVKGLDPKQPAAPVVATGLRPTRVNNVIGGIFGKVAELEDARASDVKARGSMPVPGSDVRAGSTPALATNDEPTLCIYCTFEPIDLDYVPYCGPQCAINAQNE